MTEGSSPNVLSADELLQRDLLFLDCEMSGGDAERHDIIEIGAVRTRLSDLSVLEDLSLKVAPRSTHGTNPNALRVAGYSAKGWKSAVPIDEALRQLAQIADGTLLVGWATYNDLLFVQAAAARAGLDGLLGEAYVETQDWAQQRLRFERSPGLQRVADQMKIVRDQDHSALEDALVTYEVFRMLWRFNPEATEQALGELDWTSYADLAGPIRIDAKAAEERRAELGRFVRPSNRESMLALRGVFRRD